MPTGFHPNTHFFPAHFELAVELLRFLAVPQFPLVPFTTVRIDKRNLLEARVIVTTYNDHVRLLSPNMIIIVCDYHPGFQQIAFVTTYNDHVRLLSPSLSCLAPPKFTRAWEP